MEATQGEVAPAAQMAAADEAGLAWRGLPVLQTPLSPAWGTGCLAPHPSPPSFPFHSTLGAASGVEWGAQPSQSQEIESAEGGREFLPFF